MRPGQITSGEVFPLAFTVISFLMLSLVGQSKELRLTNMVTPEVADIRDDIELRCEFDLGVDDLYGVKWYKDDHEFFRFMPGPKFMSYPVPGVHIVTNGTDCTHNYCHVKLHKLSRLNSGGFYRCEISGEGPQFRLASETHKIIVAALPKENPAIEILTSYEEGNTLSAKCTSDLSDPAPQLSWYINGQEAPPSTVGKPMSTKPDALGLVSRSITLVLPIEHNLFRGNSIEIRCESAIPGVPLPPRAVARSISRRSDKESDIKNQKLHWQGYGLASRVYPSIHKACRFILLGIYLCILI